MAYPKLATLAKRLFEKTNEGSLQWEETAKTGVYQASFSNYSVQMSTEPSIVDPEEVDVRVAIFDKSGELIEEFTDFDLSDFPDPFPKQTYYLMMKDTYETARRIALGSERAINEILNELGDDKIPF